ncbi:MAG: DUF4384 domain-containing protein [Paludibacteraceae bacterium]|nr:DUF4384 domain-containing protein [Paludibacteraceae bacterium]
MKYITLIFSALLIGLVSFASDIKPISITYEYISDNPNETPEQAEQTAIQLAKQKALEENFGLDVVGITSTIQRSRQEGGQATATSDVFSIKETSVRGEWIETIEEKILQTTFEQGFWHVRVFVKGKARNHSTDKPQIKYAFINNAHDRQNRDQYYDGDNIYLRFASPVSGALCVYLVDAEQNAYCLLPYQTATKGYQMVEANQDYLFFSFATDKDADEYELTCMQSSEQNALYVIFSPNTFTKALDKQAGKNWRDDQLPRFLSYEDLMKWLAQNQTRDKNMVVRREVITIKK